MTLSVRTGLAIVFTLLAASSARADVFSNVPEAADYSLVYTLPIPNSANFRDATPIPYSVDNSASVGFYDRVAYYMELDTGSGLEYVYASMDSFNNMASQIGLPHNIDNPRKYQQIVDNMNVFSNKAGITIGTGIATGNIEMWSTNYGGQNDIGIPGAGGSWDFGDGGAGVGTGYGSFQVHNHGASQVLFAYNRWGAGGTSDLGIGNRADANTDWTFAGNANTYTTKNLQILVREVPPPPALPAPADIVAKVAEAADFSLVYQKDIPATSGGWNSGLTYEVDNRAAHLAGQYERVAYFLELEHTASGASDWIYISMDPFTTDVNKIGIPNVASGAVFQTAVDNMNVFSNVAGIVEGTDLATGNIEFWPSNYNPNGGGIYGSDDGAFDFGDGGFNGGAGHATMQIHNHGAQQTLFGYNAWGAARTSELGIGNAPGGHTDWTFNTANIGTYDVRTLYVLVQEPVTSVPEPSTFALAALGLLGLAVCGWRKRRLQQVAVAYAYRVHGRRQ